MTAITARLVLDATCLELSIAHPTSPMARAVLADLDYRPDNTAEVGQAHSEIILMPGTEVRQVGTLIRAPIQEVSTINRTADTPALTPTVQTGPDEASEIIPTTRRVPADPMPDASPGMIRIVRSPCDPPPHQADAGIVTTAWEVMVLTVLDEAQFEAGLRGELPFPAVALRERMVATNQASLVCDPTFRELTACP